MIINTGKEGVVCGCVRPAGLPVSSRGARVRYVPVAGQRYAAPPLAAPNPQTLGFRRHPRVRELCQESARIDHI